MISKHYIKHTHRHQPPGQPALTEGLWAPEQLFQKQCRATGVAAKGPEGDVQEITQDASAISKWQGTGEQRAWEGDRLKRGGKSSRRDGRREYTFFAPCSSSTPSPITM